MAHAGGMWWEGRQGPWKGRLHRGGRQAAVDREGARRGNEMPRPGAKKGDEALRECREPERRSA